MLVTGLSFRTVYPSPPVSRKELEATTTLSPSASGLPSTRISRIAGAAPASPPYAGSVVASVRTSTFLDSPRVSTGRLEPGCHCWDSSALSSAPVRVV